MLATLPVVYFALTDTKSSIFMLFLKAVPIGLGIIIGLSILYKVIDFGSRSMFGRKTIESS